jgi:hypothetical protein
MTTRIQGIENNMRRIAIQEEMAQRLFRESAQRY